MTEDSRRFSNSLPLAGARVWLSGSAPDEGLTEGQRAAILDFVRGLARRVFERGGHIVHGSTTSFTPTLLEEARRHQQQGGRRDCLLLAVSRLWSKDQEAVPAEEWRKAAVVYETPEATGEHAREESLELLRKWMVSRSDAIVVVGGRWWQEVSGRPGIPLEFGLAVERGLPCFLLGGFGGAAKEFASRHPEVFAQLKNGFDEHTNREISTREDVGGLAEFVCDRLELLPLVRGRGSDGVSLLILALDGGWLKGAFTASALATW